MERKHSCTFSAADIGLVQIVSYVFCRFGKLQCLSRFDQNTTRVLGVSSVSTDIYWLFSDLFEFDYSMTLNPTTSSPFVGKILRAQVFTAHSQVLVCVSPPLPPMHIVRTANFHKLGVYQPRVLTRNFVAIGHFAALIVSTLRELVVYRCSFCHTCVHTYT